MKDAKSKYFDYIKKTKEINILNDIEENKNFQNLKFELDDLIKVNKNQLDFLNKPTITNSNSDLKHNIQNYYSNDYLKTDDLINKNQNYITLTKDILNKSRGNSKVPE